MFVVNTDKTAEGGGKMGARDCANLIPAHITETPEIGILIGHSEITGVVDRNWPEAVSRAREE